MPLKTPSTKQTFYYKTLGIKEYKTSSNANTKKQLLGKAKLFRFIFHTNFSARKKPKKKIDEGIDRKKNNQDFY